MRQNLKRYCLALDLKSDEDLIEQYKSHHRKVWPEIRKSISDAGIFEMDIYLVGNRLFMIMETDETFSLEAKAESDRSNPIVQKWEELMWEYQAALPQATQGEKWMLMDHIFSLTA